MLLFAYSSTLRTAQRTRFKTGSFVNIPRLKITQLSLSISERTHGTKKSLENTLSGVEISLIAFHYRITDPRCSLL